MARNLIVRLAREVDFDDVARIWHDGWATIGVTEAPRESVPELRAHIPENIAGGWKLYVAEESGVLRAMMALIPAEAHLDQLFVDPPYHGQGIGSVLLARAKQEMPQGMGLRTARKNAQAIAFYKRHGFVHERDDVHPRYTYPVVYYRWPGDSPMEAI